MLKPMDKCRPINTNTGKTAQNCPFNGAVVCADRNGCDRCGWNPDVEKKRKKRIMQDPKGRRDHR